MNSYSIDQLVAPELNVSNPEAIKFKFGKSQTVASQKMRRFPVLSKLVSKVFYVTVWLSAVKSTLVGLTKSTVLYLSSFAGNVIEMVVNIQLYLSSSFSLLFCILCDTKPINHVITARITSTANTVPKPFPASAPAVPQSTIALSPPLA